MTKLIDIRCSCGKLLGRVQEGAAHEHKCYNSRCKHKPKIVGPAIDVITHSFGGLKKGDIITIEGFKAPRRLGQKRRELKQFKISQIY